MPLCAWSNSFLSLLSPECSLGQCSLLALQFWPDPSASASLLSQLQNQVTSVSLSFSSPLPNRIGFFFLLCIVHVRGSVTAPPCSEPAQSAKCGPHSFLPSFLLLSLLWQQRSLSQLSGESAAGFLPVLPPCKGGVWMRGDRLCWLMGSQHNLSLIGCYGGVF